MKHPNDDLSMNFQRKEDRIPSRPIGGQFDDAIEWLGRLLNVMRVWADPQDPPCHNAIYTINEANTHRHTVTKAGYGIPPNHLMLIDSWKPVDEAVKALCFEMQRGGKLPQMAWAELIREVEDTRSLLKNSNRP